MKKSGILAQAFGVPSTIKSNLIIAEIASKKAEVLGAPVFTQLDVQVKLGIQVVYCTEKPGFPPPTLRICRGAVQWAIKDGIDEIWIACAEPHLWRVARDLKYSIKEAKAEITVRICEEIKNYKDDDWYRPDSEQKRTCSRKEWVRRELILIVLPMFIYKRVAA
jgi:hypothetical protein